MKQKLVKCKSCGAEIAKNAKVCPQCGGKNNQPSAGRLVLGLIAAFVVVILAVSVMPSNDVTYPQSNSASAGSPVENNVEDVSELIFEMDGLQIWFTGFSAPPEPLNGYYINFHIENNSDADYVVQADNLSANDTMIPFGFYMFSPEILAGKKLNDRIWILGEENTGLTLPITSAEFNFSILTTGLERIGESDMISIGE